VQFRKHLANLNFSDVPQVLDAPSLQDDFYLNLVDWSSQNMLAVGLGTCVYLWSASSSKVSSIDIAVSFFFLRTSGHQRGCLHHL
jgi:hypothetical protein